MTTKISRAEVQHVANLARLTLSEDELESMTQQLDTLLMYFDKLQQIDTTGIQPTTHTFQKTNAFREDVLLPSLPVEKTLANAPDATEEMFKVPRVI